MEPKDSEGLIAAIISIIIICIILVIFFMIFQKKKNNLLLKQIEVEKHFEQEIGESQIAIREQTLRNISWELHDNIGQLLTLAKIQLQSVPDHPENIKEVNENLSNILAEVRALSKVINPDFISSIRLNHAIQLEIDRFNRLDYIKASLDIEGEEYDIDSKAEIVIFRVLQEFFSNTIKHSKATKLDVFINFGIENLIITAADNGIGFDANSQVQNGLGLNNMKKRGNLINAEIEITSEINNGTMLTIVHKRH